MNIIRLQGDAEKRKGIYYEYDVDATPLGEGGMGRVFKGFRVVERTGERMPVAVKAIYDNIPERVVERARREAEIQLDNDNLIRMYGFVETISHYEGGTKCKVHYHVIMELLIGVTLEDIMNGITSDQNGMQIPFAAELYTQYTQDRYSAVVRIIKPILSGLMALHDKGYIHRDIDPSNIMVTIDGKIKLIDFGICKQIVSLESLDKALTASGVFMGKVNYAAPEMVLGDVRSQNYTTDIYALGILLYQLCAGHLPFSGTDQDILTANLRNPLPMKDIKKVEFKRIIRKATEKVQSKRYASVAELRVALDRIPVNNGNHIDSRKTIKYSVLFLIMIAIIAGSVFLFKSKEIPPVPSVITKTCDELYEQALTSLNQKDSVKIQLQGKEQLRILAEDSLYAPAQLKYYVILLNSRVPEDVQKGFTELEKIAQTDSLNHVAMFECGLTLSKGNNFFDVDVPSTRQFFLNRNSDLEQANQWLYKSMEMDTTDYKSVYWIFNNMMDQKISGSLDSNADKQIIDLYRLFMKRVDYHKDVVSEKYRNAIRKDSVTLRTWGLLK